MEHGVGLISRGSRKRKVFQEKDESSGVSMDELNEDLLERVLSWLPTSTFFRLNSVSKRWNRVATSASFKLACSEVPCRDPWFYMVNTGLNKSIVFDSSERSWKKLKHSSILLDDSNIDSIPVAASGGLVCFRKAVSGNFMVCNPVTGSCRELPPLDPSLQDQSLHAVSMEVSSKEKGVYKVVLVYGEFPKLAFKIFNSSTDSWEEDVNLRRNVDDCCEFDSNDEDAVYFLSKGGNVMATNMQRSPSKQYSSVLTVENGEEIVYFLSTSGTIVATNLMNKSFLEYPRLLPLYLEYSIDVVECRGEMLAVVLSEFLETASLRVWRFDQRTRSWRLVSAMPPSMSHDFYGKKMDINCVGAGDRVFVCLSSSEVCSYVMCDLVTDEWVELPKCCKGGETFEFTSAFSFEPRIEASV